jgi:hypothetical protein
VIIFGKRESARGRPASRRISSHTAEVPAPRFLPRGGSGVTMLTKDPDAAQASQPTDFAPSRRAEWLSRPRIHTGIIEADAKDEEIAKAMAKLFEEGELSVLPVVDPESIKRQQERARELDKLAKSIGLSDERFTQFKRVVVAFRREPTIENYLQIRREFSEVEIQVSHFGGLESLFALKDKFRAQGIDPHLISAAFDADEPAIDALSLRLLELLAERRKLPTNGPGHIEQRRNAISDSMVNYLILEMLEAIDWNDVEVRIPASLIVLIREQLGGANLDLHTEAELRERQQSIGIGAGQFFPKGKKISARQLAKVTSISKSTAARWLVDKGFLTWVELGRSIARGEPEGFIRKGCPTK